MVFLGDSCVFLSSVLECGLCILDDLERGLCYIGYAVCLFTSLGKRTNCIESDRFGSLCQRGLSLRCIRGLC